MLVLARGHGESIVIAGQIVVTIVDIRGGKVRVGVVADKSLPILRGELYDDLHGAGSTNRLIWGGPAPKRGMEPMST